MELLTSFSSALGSPSYFGAPLGFVIVWVLMSIVIGIRVAALSKWKPAGLIFCFFSLVLSPFFAAIVALFSNFDEEEDLEKESKRFINLYLHCWQYKDLWKNCPEVDDIYRKLSAKQGEFEAHVLKSMNDRMEEILHNRKVMDGLYD